MSASNESFEKRAKLELGRQLYMFGKPEEGIEPIKDLDRLAKESGLTKTVLVKHIGLWGTELVAMAQECHKNFSHASNPEVLASNEGDIVFLREELDALKEEIRAITDRNSSKRQNLLSQYNTLSEKWRKLTGVNAAMEISAKATELAAEAAIKGTLKPPGENAKKKLSSHIFDMDEDVPGDEQEPKNTNP